MARRVLVTALATAVVSVAVLAGETTPFAPSNAGAATGLKCAASSTVTRQSGYSTDTAHIETAPGARITATAHYQRITRVETSTADNSGRALISFRYVAPKDGFAVVVDVRVKLGTASGICTTRFAPS